MVVKIKYIVIKPFNNLGAVVMSGDFVECDPGRASKLRRLGLIGGVVVEHAVAPAQGVEKAIAPKVKPKAVK